MGLSGAVSLITLASCSKNIPCVSYASPPLQFSLDCHWPVHGWDWPSSWLTVNMDPNHSVRDAVLGLTCTEQLALAGSGVLRFFWACHLWTNQTVIWSQPLRVLVLGLLGGTPGQINVRHCLWPALGYLLGGTKWFTVGGCLCWA